MSGSPTPLLIGLVTLLCTAGCVAQPRQTGSANNLKLLSDIALGDVPQSLVNDFEANHSDSAPDLQKATRQVIIDTLRADGADAAFLLSDPSPQGEQIFSTPIGYEPIVVVVNPDVPIDNLQESDLRGIVDGQITRWSQVNGSDSPIQVIVPQSGSSERAALESALAPNLTIGQSVRVVPDSAYVNAAVMSTPGGIGILSATFLDQEGARVLSIEGIAPPSHEFNAYRLTSPFLLAAPREPQGLVKELLAWLLAGEGQAAMRRLALGVNR